MMKIHSSTVILAILILLAITFAAFVEIALAICASGTYFILYGLFWTLVLAPFLFWHPTRWKFAIYAGMVICLIILYIVPWNSRKTFLRDFSKVKVGMTLSEVEAIMGRYMKGTGWFSLLESNQTSARLTDVGSGITFEVSASPEGEVVLQDCMTYRHSDDGAFNSDWGVVKFENGRVMMKIFLPD